MNIKTRIIVLLLVFIVMLPIACQKNSSRPEAQDSIQETDQKLDSLAWNWMDDVPYSDAIPYKTYHDIDKILPPLIWPSLSSGVQFLPIAKPGDAKPQLIPITPMEHHYKYLQVAE